MRRRRLEWLLISGLFLLGCKGRNSNIDVSVNDPTFNLAKSLIEKDWVVVPPGDHYIRETIIVPGYKRITGILGRSKLIASPGFTGPIMELDGAVNVEISGISFEGNQTQFSNLSSICNTRDEIREFEGKTNGIGIYIRNNANRCWINACEFKNFGETALKISNAGGREYPVRITNLSISNSFCGIDYQGTEYSPATSVSVTNCVFGMIVDAGNQYFSACSFNDNRVGLYLGSTNRNNSHGSFSACNFNHSKIYSIFSDGIDFGETFVGCQVFDGDIFLENSNGFIFNGGIIDAQVFVKGGKTNLISNTGFLTSYGGGKIYRNFEGSSTRLLLRNNFFIQEMGKNDSILNNGD